MGNSWNLDIGGRRGSRGVPGTLIEEEDLGVYLEPGYRSEEGI